MYRYMYIVRDNAQVHVYIRDNVHVYMYTYLCQERTQLMIVMSVLLSAQFCQPLGWSLSPSASPPSLTTFILTAEDGRRLFCSSLTFHQLRKQKQRSSKRLMSVPTEQDVCNVANRRKMMRMKTSPSFDYLDEVNEANWSPESIVNQPKDMYEPLCLCLVSRLPLFDLLQVGTSVHALRLLYSLIMYEIVNFLSSLFTLCYFFHI